MRFSRLEHLVFYKTRGRGMINGRDESKRIAGKYKITNIPVGEFFCPKMKQQCYAVKMKEKSTITELLTSAS